MANKVEFGISELYVGTYTVGTNGTVTMGSPYHQKGAVSFSPSPQSSENNFYADNIRYFSEDGGSSLQGDLSVAMFDDDFKTNFLGYQAATGGGLALVKGASKPKTYVMFQTEGDDKARKVIFYNCTLGDITRAYNTITDSKTPDTEAIQVTVDGDNKTGITMVTYKQGDSAYATLFTNPPAPALST